MYRLVGISKVVASHIILLMGNNHLVVSLPIMMGYVEYSSLMVVYGRGIYYHRVLKCIW